MKKIPSLFKRNFEGNRLLYDAVTPGCEWVIDGEGVATDKWDGTACAVIDGELYARYDAKVDKRKAGKPLYDDGDFKVPPPGAIPCQGPDRITGHWPHWIKVEGQPEYQHHKVAYEQCGSLEDGTYELVGKHFQSNPYGMINDIFIKHGWEVWHDAPRDFEGLREWLRKFQNEGIVWHHPDGRMCKIKRRDFGYPWPIGIS